MTGLCAQIANPLQGIATPIGNVGAATAYDGQFLLPYPEFSKVISAGKYYGESSYNALLASLKKRFAAGSTVNLSYTWAHLITNANSSLTFLEPYSSGSSAPQDYTNPRADRARLQCRCAATADRQLHLRAAVRQGETIPWQCKRGRGPHRFRLVLGRNYDLRSRVPAWYDGRRRQ